MTATNPDADQSRQVKELARVIGDATRAMLLERVAQLRFDTAEFVSFFKGLAPETDRAVAIVTFSYVDEQLRELMLRAMNPETPGGADTLFEPLGPLGTASARLRMAAALYWISPATFQGLDLMRKIRNEFAHNSSAAGFDQKRVRGLHATLHSLLSGFEDHIWKGMKQSFVPRTSVSERLLFQGRAVILTHRMIAELLTAPIALRLGMAPHSALAGEQKDSPPVLRDLYLATSDILLAIYGAPKPAPVVGA